MNNNKMNVNTGGGSVVGSAIGSGSTASNNIISIKESFSSTKNSTNEELAAVLSEIQLAISQAKDIDADSSDDMQSNLNATIKVFKKAEPNKVRAVEKLEGIQKILESVKGSVGSVAAIGKLVQKALALLASSL